MNIIIKSAISVIIGGFIILNMSCRKARQKKEEEEKPQVTEPAAEEVLVPVKFISDHLTIDLKYQVNTPFLTEISDSDGSKFIVTYKDEQPFKFDKYESGTVNNFTDYWMTDNKATKTASFAVKGFVYFPSGERSFIYNSEDQISRIKHISADVKLSQESSIFYSKPGNISKITTISSPDHQTSQTEYTYDTKNSIFKNIRYAQLLFLETNYNFFLYGQNNCITSSHTETPGDHITFGYEYNSNNYPSQITINKNGNAQTFKITYARVL